MERLAEATMRVREEAASHIAQAAFEMDAGKFADAVALVRKTSVEDVFPTIEAAKVTGNLGGGTLFAVTGSRRRVSSKTC